MDFFRRIFGESNQPQYNSDPVSVFISYRRSVGAFIAKTVFDNLRNHQYDVFMDVENLNSGTFDTILLHEIASRDNFIMILTPGTLERCIEKDDWVRREIEYAIETERNIIPLMINNFEFKGNEDYLVGKLQELKRYNGISVPFDFFDEAMQRLQKRFLKSKIIRTKPSLTTLEQEIVNEKINIVASQPAPTREELSAEYYFGQGFALQQKEEYPAAIEKYNLAIELNPDYRRAFYNRGLAFHRLSDLENAEKDYTRAIEIEPNYAKGYHNLGVISYEREEYDQAVERLTQAIAIDPDFSIAYFNRHKAHLELGNEADAEKDLKHYQQLIKAEQIASTSVTRQDHEDDVFYAEETVPVDETLYAPLTRPLPTDEIMIASSHISFGQASDMGLVRTNNQDATYSFYVKSNSVDEFPDFGIFAVADGLEGNQDGERASALTIKIFAQEVIARIYTPILTGSDISDPDQPTIIEVMVDAIEKANASIREQVPDGGTTLTSVVIRGDIAYISHVGDSRAYWISNRHEIELLTRDHLFTTRLMELGEITPEEAETHELRNVLYRAIGLGETVDVETRIMRLASNSALLLCSDGLWKMVNDKDILTVFIQNPDPQEACDKLVALANAHGGTDNISVIIIKLL